MAKQKIKVRLNPVMEKLGLGLHDPDRKANPKPIAKQNYDEKGSMTVVLTPFVSSRLDSGDLKKVGKKEAKADTKEGKDDK